MAARATATDSAAVEVPPPAPGGYRPEIDGLRAVAVLAVIVHHLHRDALPSGYLGVDIFFVISGFVITTSLLRWIGRSREGGGLGDLLLGFYLRRIQRLVPALAACVLLTSLALCLINPDPAESLETGIWSLLGLANLHLHHKATDYFGLAGDLNAFTQTWSLGVEEQFYFLFPTLFWFSGAGRSGRRGGRRLAWMLVALSLASLFTFVLQSRTDPSAAYFLLPARFWEIGAGGLLCLGLRGRSPGWLARIPTLPVGIGLLAALLLPRSAWVPATVIVVLATVLLLASLRPGTVVQAALRQPLLVFVGLISYSLYLWHWSVIVLSRWSVGIHAWTLPLQLAAMFLLAWASYRWIEQPLRHATWSPRRWLALLYGLVVLGISALPLRLLAGARPGPLYLGDRQAYLRSSFDLATSVAGTTISEDNCEHSTPTTFRDCVVPPLRRGAPTILLQGDSHAQHLYPLMGELRRRRGFGLASFAPGGHSFPLFFWQDPNSDRSREAAAFHRRQVDRLGRGDILMLSSRLEALLDPATEPAAGGLPAEGQRGGRPGSAAPSRPGGDHGVRLWGEAVVRLARELRPRGVTVVVVLSVPSFPLREGESVYPASACLPAWFRPHPDPACAAGLRRPRPQAVAVSERVNRGLIPLLEREPNIVRFDPFDHFCPATSASCTAAVGGIPMFRDDNHLSLDGSLSLADDLLALLDQHGIGGTASPDPGSSAARRRIEGGRLGGRSF